MKLKTIYWIRFGLALAVALLSGFLRIWGLPGVSLAILVYMLSHGVFRTLAEDVERKKVLLEGIGTYFLVWLTVWTILYNFLR